MLNRSAVVVKPKQPFLDWLHNAHPTSRGITLDEVGREPTISLIPEWDTKDEVHEVLEELCEEIFVDVRRWREAKEPYKGASTVTKDRLKHWASRDRFRRLFFCQRAVETIIYLHEILIPGRQRSTGFGDFKLTDTDVKQLLRGERPDFSKRVLIVNAELSLR